MKQYEREKAQKEENLERIRYESQRSILPMLYQKQILAYHQKRYCFKLINNPKEMPVIIFDFGLSSNWKNELMLNELISQISNVFEMNVRAEYPFKICLFNYEKESEFHRSLMMLHGSDVLLRNLIFENEKSFFKIFPSEKLVYLSCDSPNDMCKYDPSKVYIIG